MYTKEDFNKIKDIILDNVPNPEQIILFGSYARGNPTKDSDMDYLILTRDKLSRKDRLTVLTNIRWTSARSGYKSDFIIKSYNDFQRDQYLPSIFNHISKEGKIIWKLN